MDNGQSKILDKIGKRFWFLIGTNGLILVLFITLIIIVIVEINKDGNQELKSTKNSDCNVQIINLNGILDTTYVKYSDGSETGAISSEIIAKLINAQEDSQIKAVVLSVDSGGGSPVAGSEIADYLASFKKPSVAWFRNTATSAAYWASIGANRIIANRNSIIGSIGVTSSYVDETQKNKREGLIFQQLSIGKYKDLGNPNKPISSDEKNIIMQGAEKIYENFIGAVAYYRNINSKDVKKLADGSYFLGEEALSDGLIDQVGSINDVKVYLENRINKPVEFCWQ
jgi:protease-4